MTMDLRRNPPVRLCRWIFALATVLTLLLIALPALAQTPPVKRIILTDGSYQTATEWKRNGDRVKYFSAERGEWEELPASLIDWKATDDWNAERAKSAADQMKEVTADEIAARKEADMNAPLVSPEVAPNLHLPAEGGVFAFEQPNGKPALTKLEGAKLQVNDHEATTMLKRSINPIASQIETVEIAGPAAKLRLHSATPFFYVSIDDDHGNVPGDSFRLVRLERKKNLRQVAKNKASITGESSSEHYLQSRAEKFSGDWWKIIPLVDLAPGEYALVLAGVNDDANGSVWDFGVDK